MGGQYTNIESNSDLDTFIDPGLYYSYSSSVTNTISNTPTGSSGYAFRLEVIPLRRDNNLLMQLLISAREPIKMFVRRYNNGWNGWCEVTGITAL